MFTDSMDQVKPCGHCYPTDCHCEVTQMSPEDAARYWREHYDWAKEQLSIQNEVAERLSKDLQEAITAIRVLMRLRDWIKP